MRYDGFIFDQDNTLVASEVHWPGLDGAYFPTLIGDEGWKTWQPDWLDMRAKHVAMDEMLGILKERFKLTQEIATIKADREATMFKLYRENGLQALPGAEEILAFAKESGIPVAVASGMNLPIIRFVTEYMGWSMYVKAMASTHEGSKRNKPHPDVYLLAAERLGVDPAKCVAFENDWKGYQAAKAAGMDCYAITDDQPARRSELEAECAKLGVPTYSSLLEVLADLRGGNHP